LGNIGKPPDHLAIAPGVHVNGVWVEPVPGLVHGEIKDFASQAAVEPVRIPGYWLDAGERVQANAPPAPGEKVVLHLHGGGYVFGSASPDDMTALMSRGLLAHVQSLRRTFALEYRLAQASGGPFPAALLDALAGYNHLVNVAGFAPQDIVICGDSAGGNLALALVRYLFEERAFLERASKTPLAPPGGLILASPWVDLGTSHDAPPPSYLARTDYIGTLPIARAKFAHAAFAGPLGLVAHDTNRWTSPASKHVSLSFAGWPRTFLAVGGAEVQVPSMSLLKERMAADMGEGMRAGQVYYCEPPGAVHDYMVLGWHEPERTETFRKVAEWFAFADE
jgi:acetyl esterase/lipase